MLRIKKIFIPYITLYIVVLKTLDVMPYWQVCSSRNRGNGRDCVFANQGFFEKKSISAQEQNYLRGLDLFDLDSSIGPEIKIAADAH